mgnify:CR=1 FL=1
MPWIVEWYDWVGEHCVSPIPIAGEAEDSMARFRQAKGEMISREVIWPFKFERFGITAGGKGYTKGKPNAMVYMVARGVFFAPLKAKITLGSDDGSQLWLEPGKSLIENLGPHPYREVSQELTLPPLVVLRLEFFDNCWSGGVKIEGPLW